MEEGHVVEPKRQGDGGIVLVARAADRVEALAAGLQPAREPVQLAAGALAVEQVRHRLARKPDLIGAGVGEAARQLAVTEPGDELFVNCLGGVHPRFPFEDRQPGPPARLWRGLAMSAHEIQCRRY